MFLEEEVEQWLEAQGLQRLHSVSHKDVEGLLLDLPGTHTSSSVSFGLRQLVPPSSLSQPSHVPASSYYSSSFDANHVRQFQQPFSQILGTAHDFQQSSDTEKPFGFRHFVVRNNTPGEVRLLDVRFSSKLPLWPNTMALTDDVGVSATIRDADLNSKFRLLAVSSHPPNNSSEVLDQQQRQRRTKRQLARKHRKVQQQESAQGGETKPDNQQQQQHEKQKLHGGQHHLAAEDSSSSLQQVEPAAEGKRLEGVQCVLLHPGEEYLVTVVLNCEDGPHRKSECGVLPQLVLFTLMVPHAEATPGSPMPQQPASSFNYTSGYGGSWATWSVQQQQQQQQQHAPHVVKQKETISLHNGSLADVVVVARQVSVCLVSKSDADDQQKMLNVEAKLFVPESLRTLFDEAPSAFMSGVGFQDALLDKGLARGGESEPACLQPPVSETAEHAGSSATTRGSVAEQVRRWVRLLRLEESAMHQDIKRFDMFSVKLHEVKFDANQRSYFLQSLLKDEPEQKRRFPYRGPNLHALFKHSTGYIENAKTKLPILFTIQVPGLVEKRPNLIIGDVVYLRFAAEPGTEWSCWVVVIQDAQCMLCVPNLDPQSDLARTGLVHVRFTFDRTPFRRMLRALHDAGHHPRAMQLLPPHIPTMDPPEGSSAHAKASLPSDDLFRQALLSPGPASAPLAAKDVQVPTVGKLQRKAGFLEELGSQKLNSQQRQAVASVLVGAGGGTLPLALFGPPGTGKTVTLVECALQVYRTIEGARLLMCAPQNYSADLLFKALAAAGISNEFMIRLNDPRIPPAQVQADVRPRCMYNEETGYFGLPTPEQLAAYHIVVCTCGAAGMLREGDYGVFYQRACQRAAGDSPPGVRPLEFTHVMIDEAGQALGPEALIPLTLLAQQGSCAMLCGDPRQLGPVLHSPKAESHGLGTSLLEAFVHYHKSQSQLYAKQGLAPCLGMLVHNYRCHSRLLELPSRLYYDNQLLASADPSLVTAPLWSELQHSDRGEEGEGQETGDGEEHSATQDPGGQHITDAAETGQDDADSQLPVNTLFYGVRGQQMRDGEAPSYYNPVEASTLVRLVQGLLSYSGAGVSVQDIGVIATYRNQVKKIRLLLRERNLGAVRVGTVDDFQGQEARIIFISTVLSRPADAPLAAGHSKPWAPPSLGGIAADPAVGFFRNPNRFNVAITRAQALMVVLGHPLVLMQDPNWSELVKYCAARGAYRGAGSEALGQLVRNQPSDDSYLPGESAEQLLEDDSVEIQQAVSHIAEAALLGVGDASKMFPQSLEEMYESYASNEMEFRVIL
ncbi:hypothetical protein ABBQ32_004519 [Trebouxia sp. C0010 RCD-2024]